MYTMVLKETLLYYNSNPSSVYCTFLDASKAFDRVQYHELFRKLIRQGLPACIVRILAVLYTSSHYGQVLFPIISLYQTELSKGELSALF